MQVATYSDGTAHLQKVVIAEDNGAQVEIATGLAPGQDLIVESSRGDYQRRKSETRCRNSRPGPSKKLSATAAAVCAVCV